MLLECQTDFFPTPRNWNVTCFQNRHHHRKTLSLARPKQARTNGEWLNGGGEDATWLLLKEQIRLRKPLSCRCFKGSFGLGLDRVWAVFDNSYNTLIAICRILRLFVIILSDFITSKGISIQHYIHVGGGRGAWLWENCLVDLTCHLPVAGLLVALKLTERVRSHYRWGGVSGKITRLS